MRMRQNERRNEGRGRPFYGSPPHPPSSEATPEGSPPRCTFATRCERASERAGVEGRATGAELGVTSSIFVLKSKATL